MPRRSYERLPIEQFGRQLITSGDLDPVYIALHRCAFSFDTMAKWLISYWCLYHCGVASYLAGSRSDSVFWDRLMAAARNETLAPTGGRWPRGSERRHWRGQQATKSVMDLSSRGSPAKLVESIFTGPMDYAAVAARVREWRGFGDWIGFKVADMLDRVLRRPVDFNEAAVFMFKDPRKAALMQWDLRHPTELSGGRETEAIHSIVNSLTKEFSSLTAPPLYDRPIGLQEVETVLCKWKSHMNGHYPLFNDTDDINEGMVGWVPHSDEAVLFANNMVSRDPRR